MMIKKEKDIGREDIWMIILPFSPLHPPPSPPPSWLQSQSQQVRLVPALALKCPAGSCIAKSFALIKKCPAGSCTKVSGWFLRRKVTCTKVSGLFLQGPSRLPSSPPYGSMEDEKGIGRQDSSNGACWRPALLVVDRRRDDARRRRPAGCRGGRRPCPSPRPPRGRCRGCGRVGR